LINATGQAVTDIFICSAYENSPHSEDDLQVLLDYFADAAASRGDSGNLIAMRAWIRATACESVVLAANHVCAGKPNAPSAPGTITTRPATTPRSYAKHSSVIADILPSALECICGVAGKAEVLQPHCAYSQVMATVLSAVAGFVRLSDNGGLPAKGHVFESLQKDLFQYLNVCHQLASAPLEDDAVVVRLGSYMQSVSKTLTCGGIAHTQMGTFNSVHIRLLLLHVELATQLVTGCVHKGLSQVAQAALWTSVRTLIVNAPNDTRSLAYDALSNLIAHGSPETDAFAALILLEGCLVAERTVVHWSGAPSPRSLDALASSLLSLSTRVLSEECEASLPTELVLSSIISCLELVASKDKAFSMPPQQVACCLRLPSEVMCRMSFTQKLYSVGGRSCMSDRGAYLFSSCCGLLGALLRHHAAESNRCMAIVATSVRDLLRSLLLFPPSAARLPPSSALAGAGRAEKDSVDEPSSDGQGLLHAKNCATRLSDVLFEIAAHGTPVSKYCVYILADYINATVSASTRVVPDSGPPGVYLEIEPMLRLGAMSLYGISTPQEVQHLHTMLGQAAGGSKRQALEGLRRDYEKTFKYSGKV